MELVYFRQGTRVLLRPGLLIALGSIASLKHPLKAAHEAFLAARDCTASQVTQVAQLLGTAERVSRKRQSMPPPKSSIACLLSALSLMRQGTAIYPDGFFKPPIGMHEDMAEM